MTLQKIVIIPYDECDCYEDFISWKTTHMIPLLQEAAQYDYAILKIHSHPGGGRFFPNRMIGRITICLIRLLVDGAKVKSLIYLLSCYLTEKSMAVFFCPD